MTVLAQIIGIIAMVFNILSYQGKKQKSVIALQLVGCTLFCLNYLLLGATVGGLLNIIGTVRSVVFLFKDKIKADRPIFAVLFSIAFFSVYILNFFVFGKEITAKNLIIELLPVFASILLTLSYRLKSAAKIRLCGLISSPAWLTYNITVGSIGAIICEVLTLSSIIIGIIRHDKK